MKHPAGPVMLRDLGILCRPPAINSRFYRVKLERQRTGAVTELPTRSPGFLPTGSRGLIAFQATGIVVVDSLFVGNYQDPLHIPSSFSSLIGNTIENAVRVGLIVVDAPDPRPSVNHLVVNNVITDSTGDGIQIHGDSSLVVDNTVLNSAAFGIHICGDGTCLPPGVESTKNYILDNAVSGSGLADFADFGEDNLFDGLDTNRDCTVTDPCTECAPRDCDNDNQCLPHLLCADQHKSELQALGLDKRRADCGPATDGAQPNWEVCYQP